MARIGNWTILGENPVAETLRAVAGFVDAPTPLTLATQPGEIPDNAFAIGPAILSSSVEHVVPYYSAFEAIETIQRALDAGESGRVYGCFTSFRIARGASSERVSLNALLPAVAVTLDLLRGPISRVHARHASLLAEGDAWFVTMRYADETIATIEAMAVLDPDAGISRDLLVEVTASDRVLRAEPMRQSVLVEPLNGAGTTYPWWEDLNERFLKLVASRTAMPHNNAGSRLRSTWDAIQRSVVHGLPVNLV